MTRSRRIGRESVHHRVSLCQIGPPQLYCRRASSSTRASRSGVLAGVATELGQTVTSSYRHPATVIAVVRVCGCSYRDHADPWSQQHVRLPTSWSCRVGDCSRFCHSRNSSRSSRPAAVLLIARPLDGNQRPDTASIYWVYDRIRRGIPSPRTQTRPRSMGCSAVCRARAASRGPARRASGPCRGRSPPAARRQLCDAACTVRRFNPAVYARRSTRPWSPQKSGLSHVLVDCRSGHLTCSSPVPYEG